MCVVMHRELCIICVKQSLRDRLSSQWVFHLIKSLVCNNSHLDIPPFPLRGRKGLAILRRREGLFFLFFLFSFYVLPDRRLTSYFQPHYSPVTPGQSEKSIIVKAYCVCQNPGLVISSAETFPAKC